MSKYLKKILFALLILVMPYMNSASKAMDEENCGGSTVRTLNVSFATEDRQDVLSSVKQSVSSQVVSLEDSKASWASYLISPVKANLRVAFDVVNYVFQNPKKGMVIGMIIASNVACAAAQAYDCQCLFYSDGPFIGGTFFQAGSTFSTKSECNAGCRKICTPYNITYAGYRTTYTAPMCCQTKNPFQCIGK